ncbi:MAG: glycerophosphodiester phosphodiesterase family protein [Paracoccaceae bacterium]
MTELHPDFLRRPIAHRAFHDRAAGRPENSLAAVRAAVEAGYGIEIDLQLSADGQAMVFHDYHLGRLTAEQGPVRGRSAAELAAIPLAGGSEGIPGLAAVLAEVAGRVPLLVEIKDQHGAMGETCGRLEAAAAAALEGYAGPVAVMSFNPHAVAHMARLAPDVPRGLTTCAFAAEDWTLLPEERRRALRDILDFERVGACFVSHHMRDLDRPRLDELSASGAAILSWTIRSAEDEAQARRRAANVTFEGYHAEIPA